MTRNDFEIVAEVLESLFQDASHCLDDYRDQVAVARRFGKRFKLINPRFDMAKFLEACGCSVDAMYPDREDEDVD